MIQVGTVWILILLVLQGTQLGSIRLFVHWSCTGSEVGITIYFKGKAVKLAISNPGDRKYKELKLIDEMETPFQYDLGNQTSVRLSLGNTIYILIGIVGILPGIYIQKGIRV